MKYPVRTHTLSALGMMLMSVQYALLAQGVAQGVAQNSLVEQVIVTARKRSEPATAVPMSFNVIDATTIDTFRIRNLADLAPLAHNVALFEDFPGAGIPTWIIRGVGLQDFNSNNTPAAAVHVDGVYQPSTVMGNAALFDMAQAEILKGPQGGLYGRNTTGGAVLLQSKRADASAQDYALSLTHGSWQQSQADAMANVPVSANAALRIAARIEDGNGGWQRSLVTGDEHGAKQRTTCVAGCTGRRLTAGPLTGNCKAAVNSPTSCLVVRSACTMPSRQRPTVLLYCVASVTIAVV